MWIVVYLKSMFVAYLFVNHGVCVYTFCWVQRDQDRMHIFTMVIYGMITIYAFMLDQLVLSSNQHLARAIVHDEYKL